MVSGRGVTTDRLVLRIPSAEDAAVILTIAGDFRTVQHNPSDLIANLSEAERLVSRWAEHWAHHGCGYWCVRVTGQPRTIGYCGLKATTVNGVSVLNLIYRFAPDTWGNGYATEAAAAAVAWGGAHQPTMPIIARIRPANQASQHVADKIGLRRDPELDSNGEDGVDLAFTNRG